MGPLSKCVILLVAMKTVFSKVQREVDREGWRLEAVPGYYPSVHKAEIYYIILDSNKISKIEPNAFSAYTRLRCLSIKQNQLQWVSPTAFAGAPVSSLYFDKNKLTCIPDLSVIRTTLQQLFASHNDLSHCRQESDYDVIFTSLYKIGLANNQLALLPAIVKAAPTLRYLDISFNQFNQLPNLAAIMPRLRLVKAKSNPLRCSCENIWLKRLDDRNAFDPSGLPAVCASSGPFSGWKDLTSHSLTTYCLSTTFSGQLFTLILSSINIEW